MYRDENNFFHWKTAVPSVFALFQTGQTGTLQLVYYRLIFAISSGIRHQPEALISDIQLPYFVRGPSNQI